MAILLVKLSSTSPLWIGLRAARANVIPGLIVQAVMLALGLAYYYSPPVQAWLERLAVLKGEWGYLFSFIAGGIAGGLSPEILTIAVFQKGRVTARNVENLVFGFIFWGLMSVSADALYRGQAVIFGSKVSFWTAVKKVLVDQFIYTPFWALPVTQAVYAWKNHGYRFGAALETLTFEYYKKETFPAIVAAWGVWIPLVSIVYTLPPLLQLPFACLATTFWVMIYTWINQKALRNDEC